MIRRRQKRLPVLTWAHFLSTKFWSSLKIKLCVNFAFFVTEYFGVHSRSSFMSILRSLSLNISIEINENTLLRKRNVL